MTTPESTTRPLSAATEAAWVAGGGALGALARATVGTMLAPALGGFSLATFVVNAVGSALLGALLAGLELRGPRPRVRALLAVGALGSFTTYSTLVDEFVRTASATRPGLAIAGFATSIALGLLVFFAAEQTTKRLLARRALGLSRAGSR